MITGRGNYTEDINLPGMLHVVVVRSPEAHATITSIDTSAARGAQRRGGRAHRRGHGRRLRRSAPDGLGAARRGDQDAGALAAQARRGEARGRSGGGRGRHEPARGGRRRRGRDRGVRPEARRRGPGGRARGRLAARLGAVRHEQDARVGRGRRRHRRRPRRGGGRGRAPLREPPHLGCADRAALLGGGVPRRRPHALVDHADPAHRPLRLLRDARHRRGQAAGGGPRRGRRLRREAPDLRRGGAGAGAREAARPPGEVDRDPLRAHDHEPPRARPDQLREARRQARRHAHRVSGEGDRRPRRLPAAAHAVHPRARLPGDGRVLPDPERSTCTSRACSRTRWPPTRSAAPGAPRPPTGSS